MNISQIGYDIEHEMLVLKGAHLECGDTLEVLIPSPISGNLIWVQSRLVWENQPAQRWRLQSDDPAIDEVLITCDPVGLFARR